jgi:hypothetical protein
VLLFLAVLAFILAAIDGGGALLGHPLTDVSWSPLLFGSLGMVFVLLEASPQQPHPSP